MYTVSMLRSPPAPSPHAGPPADSPHHSHLDGRWQTHRPRGRGSRQLGIAGTPAARTRDEGYKNSVLLEALHEEAEREASLKAESPQLRIIRLHREERGAGSNIEASVRAEMEARLALYFAHTARV